MYRSRHNNLVVTPCFLKTVANIKASGPPHDIKYVAEGKALNAACDINLFQQLSPEAVKYCIVNRTATSLGRIWPPSLVGDMTGYTA